MKNSTKKKQDDDTPDETNTEDPIFKMATDLTGNFNQMMALGKKITSQVFFSQLDNQHAFSDPLNSIQNWFDTTAMLMKKPDDMVETQLNLWQNYTDLCTKSLAKLNTKLHNEPSDEAQGPQTKTDSNPHKKSTKKGDKRFQSEAWEDSFFYFIKESYLVTAESLRGMIEKTSTDLDEKTRQRMLFFTQQYIDALSPSNFPMTNPEVLKETFSTGGENLVKGLKNLLHDIERGNGRLMISQTDYDAFKVGEDLATTKGKVVFRNDLIELIQYDPLEGENYEQSLLIMPPFINKYYILDMRSENSMIKWLLEQKFSTFVISWRNPTEEHSEYSFMDYVQKGLFSALTQIEEITGQKQTSVVGYCISGTMLSMALSYMKAMGDERINNVTFFASQSDFSHSGELSYFVDKQQIDNIEKIMLDHGGFLEGHEMASTFNLLRANDLIWSFVVNNYLLGREPFPFDLLYWNADTTRMPMRLQLDYLEKCYLNNDLSAGKMTLGDHNIDLSSIDIPMYIQASKEDHIAPAASVYKGAKLYNGDIRFMLAGSGHIAGVINHPSKNKYNHWIYSQKDLPETLEDWTNAATEHKGSWWNDWALWLAERSGKLVKSKPLKNGLCDAPGTYILK